MPARLQIAHELVPYPKWHKYVVRAGSGEAANEATIRRQLLRSNLVADERELAVISNAFISLRCWYR